MAPPVRSFDLKGRVAVKDGSFQSHLEAASTNRKTDVFISGGWLPERVGGLPKEKILELARKYDPQNMTQKEYVSFVDDLVEEGVLTEWDKNFIGYKELVSLGNPDGEWWGQFAVIGIGPIGTEPLRSLADADGNLLKWARHTADWVVFVGGDRCFDAIRKSEFQKMLPIVEAMNGVRR